MSTEFYRNYFEPIPRNFEEDEFCQIVPSYNKKIQKPIRTNKPRQQQPQQPQLPQQLPQQQPPMGPADLIGYTQGYLKTLIGRRVRITFLIGTDQIQDRNGTIDQVGISYVIIKDSDSPTYTLCDIYSIKFVTIFP